MREDETETAETVDGGGRAWLGGCCLKLQPVHDWWVCHALSGVSPHSTRRVRNAMTSLGVCQCVLGIGILHLQLHH